MTFKRVVRAGRATAFLILSVVSLVVAVPIQKDTVRDLREEFNIREDMKDIRNENRFSTLEAEYSYLSNDMKEVKDDLKQVKTYGIGVLIGMAALLGEKGLSIAGVRLFRKEED